MYVKKEVIQIVKENHIKLNNASNISNKLR